MNMTNVYDYCLWSQWSGVGKIPQMDPIKMKEDVGKKHANKVRCDPKLNKPLPYNPT